MVHPVLAEATQVRHHVVNPPSGTGGNREVTGLVGCQFDNAFVNCDVCTQMMAGFLSWQDGEELPAATEPLQFVLPALLELDARSGHEVADIPGHEHLIWSGNRRTALSDVDGDSTHVVSAHLDLPGVEPRADLDPESASTGTD